MTTLIARLRAPKSVCVLSTLGLLLSIILLTGAPDISDLTRVLALWILVTSSFTLIASLMVLRMDEDIKQLDRLSKSLLGPEKHW